MKKQGTKIIDYCTIDGNHGYYSNRSSHKYTCLHVKCPSLLSDLNKLESSRHISVNAASATTNIKYDNPFLRTAGRTSAKHLPIWAALWRRCRARYGGSDLATDCCTQWGTTVLEIGTLQLENDPLHWSRSRNVDTCYTLTATWQENMGDRPVTSY